MSYKEVGITRIFYKFVSNQFSLIYTFIQIIFYSIIFIFLEKNGEILKTVCPPLLVNKKDLFLLRIDNILRDSQ